MARPERWSWSLRFAAAVWILILPLALGWAVGVSTLPNILHGPWSAYGGLLIGLHWTWALACLAGPATAYLLMRRGRRNAAGWALLAPPAAMLLVIAAWVAPMVFPGWQASP